MPELPEIETIRRDLEKSLLGEVVRQIDVFDKRLMSKKQVAQWNTVLVGQKWESFGRVGKYLWVNLSNGWRAVFHMRMTGQMIVASPQVAAATGQIPGEAKSRMLITFSSGKSLGLYDQRRFAEAWLLAPGQRWHNAHIPGPDALTELNPEQFSAILKNRSTRIQPLLMDQKLIAGVGNIYAQEALFKAAIRPTRPGKRVTKTEASLLFKTLRETLEEAIVHRGSTSRNYRDTNGESGFAQNLHTVYRKGGKACHQCGTVLRAIRVGGRGSVFCPTCQK